MNRFGYGALAGAVLAVVLVNLWLLFPREWNRFFLLIYLGYVTSAIVLAASPLVRRWINVRFAVGASALYFFLITAYERLQ